MIILQLELCDLKTIEIFELLLFLLLVDRFVHHPPLVGVQALELPDGSEAPDEPDGPNDNPDDAHGVESLLDGDALPTCGLALLLEKSPVTGVLPLGPGGADDGVVLTELQGAQPQLRGGLALPASVGIRAAPPCLLHLLDSHLVHEPEREGARPHGPEVGEGVEEGHIGGSYNFVTDPCEEGDQAEEHAVECDPVYGVHYRQQDIVIPGESVVLQLHEGGDVHLDIVIRYLDVTALRILTNKVRPRHISRRKGKDASQAFIGKGPTV